MGLGNNDVRFRLLGADCRVVAYNNCISLHCSLAASGEVWLQGASQKANCSFVAAAGCWASESGSGTGMLLKGNPILNGLHNGVQWLICTVYFNEIDGQSPMRRWASQDPRAVEEVMRQRHLRGLRDYLQGIRMLHDSGYATRSSSAAVKIQFHVRRFLKQKSKKDEMTPYDAILAFESLADFLRNGKIQLLQKAESHLQVARESRYRIVAVVGLFDKGKTWLVNKLFDAAWPLCQFIPYFEHFLLSCCLKAMPHFS